MRGLNLVVWQGKDDPPSDGQESITAIYQWDAARQAWLSWFPDSPTGVNTLTLLQSGKPYMVVATRPVETGCSFERSLPTVIAATVKLSSPQGSGGAFHIGEGRFITVYHAIDGEEEEDVASSIWLHNSTLNVSATVVGYSRISDVALLRVSDEYRDLLPALERRNSTPINLPVAFVGYPGSHKESTAKVSRGHILGMVRVHGGTTSIAANYEHGPGSSGGPVVDECGRVLGIHNGFWGEDGSYPNHSAVIVDPTLSESIATILEDAE